MSGPAESPNNNVHRSTNDVRLIVDQHVATLKAELGTRIDALNEKFNTQSEDYHRVPTLLQTAILNLRELLEEKISGLVAETNRRFLSIDEKFGERDTRVDQRAVDTKLAVDAALVNLKENMAETKDGFTKQIDAMIAKIEDKSREADRRMNELKDNHTRLESALDGMKRGSTDTWAWITGAVGLAWGSASTIALLFRLH